MKERFNIYQIEEDQGYLVMRHNLIYKGCEDTLEEAEEKLKTFPNFVGYVIIPSYTNYPF